MEELLNKLIEKGWKPFGTLGNVRNSVYTNKYFFFEGCADGVTLRQIVSKESGLWQLVCENGLTIVKHPNKNKYPRDKLEREEHRDWTREQGYYGEPVKQNKWYNWDTAEYRLIESALKDESELEQFLLDNIKIEG